MTANQPNPAQQASMAARLLLAAEMERDYSVTAERLREESWPDDRFPLSTQAAIRALAARELTAAQGVERKPWRGFDAAIDSKALATAQEIALMWGNDRSQFVSRIQIAVTEAMRWMDSPQPIEPQGAAVGDKFMNLLDAAKAVKLDLYQLTTPELQAAFEGRKTIGVVQRDSLKAFRDAITDIEAALPVAVGAGEDTKLLDWLEANESDLVTHRESENAAGEYSIWWNVVKAGQSISGYPLGCPREAIHAAMTPATPAGKGA